MACSMPSARTNLADHDRPPFVVTLFPRLHAPARRPQETCWTPACPARTSQELTVSTGDDSSNWSLTAR